MNQSDLINFDWLLLALLKFLRKYFLFFVASVIVGSSIGFVYSLLKKPVYESTMIAYSSMLSDARIIEILDEIRNNLVQREMQQLATKLGLDPEVVSQLESMEFEEIESIEKTGTSLFTDYSQNCLKIEVSVFDPKIIAPLQKGIENYLRSNEMIFNVLESRKRSFEELISESEVELKKMESLQEAMIASVKEGNDVVYLVENSTVYSEKIQLLKERQLFLEELAFLAPIVVIKPFGTPENPSTSKTVFSALSGISLLLISVIAMVLRELNSQLLG